VDKRSASTFPVWRGGCAALIHPTANVAEKAVVGLFRWAATDHINKGRPIRFIPGTTFLGSLGVGASSQS